MDAEIDNDVTSQNEERATRNGYGLTPYPSPFDASHLDITAPKRLNRLSSNNDATGESLHLNCPQRSGEAWADDLKRMYDEVLVEKIPDEMVEFLRKLDNGEAFKP